MDDFGTGYSSLSYLRKFPFDKIKIDQSFIFEMSDHNDSLAIVRAVVAMSRSLGIATTAEGVETPGQFKQLKLEGCTEAQGYLFSPPRPAAEVKGILASINPKLQATA
jgi:EAL domain-containing protein (putative c-di-GMP-specific phosphodiesterase class I)